MSKLAQNYQVDVYLWGTTERDADKAREFARAHAELRGWTVRKAHRTVGGRASEAREAWPDTGSAPFPTVLNRSYGYEYLIAGAPA